MRKAGEQFDLRLGIGLAGGAGILRHADHHRRSVLRRHVLQIALDLRRRPAAAGDGFDIKDRHRPQPCAAPPSSPAGGRGLSFEAAKSQARQRRARRHGIDDFEIAALEQARRNAAPAAVETGRRRHRSRGGTLSRSTARGKRSGKSNSPSSVRGSANPIDVRQRRSCSNSIGSIRCS